MSRIYDMSDIWNDSNVHFDAIKMNVADNGAAPGSMLLDLQINNDSKFNVSPNGNVSVNGGNVYITASDTGIVFPDGTFMNTATSGGGAGGSITMGTPTLGSLVGGVTLTTTTTLPDGIAELNEVLGKLIPAPPPAFPGGQTLTINGVSSYRMANFTQTDNTTSSRSATAGATVPVVTRSGSFSTNTIANTGPGDSGNITVYENGVASGFRALTKGSDDGTYDALVISNNVDYGTIAKTTTGFWESLSVSAAGAVTAGWNEVNITHTKAGSTNTAYWYYDSSTPGTPTFSSTSIVPPGSPTLIYSSTIPHYTSANAFSVGFNVNKLSGDMYPTSDTFVTGSAGGAFGAPASVTYTSASITTPLARNLYVSSGSAAVVTTASVISGFGSSSTGPSVSVSNSYLTGTQSIAPSGVVLYKTGTSSAMEETNITFGSAVGTGSGAAARIINPGNSDTPAYTGSEADFNSQTGTLQAYDATIVGAVLKHDQTNYSTGYLPAGPNLSTGRSGSQYFTFKFVRTSVSKFDIQIAGAIAGIWVALPGSTIDTSSSLNGWLDMSVAYGGSGVPGASSGGNGSNGCAVGGTVSLNTSATQRKTCTFGTVSSSNTATHEIYVRIKLTSGQTVTTLSLQTASN